MNCNCIHVQVPIVVFHSVTSIMEKYYEEAHLFKPERWLREEENPRKHEFSAFACLPFGNGQRICPGRWLAFQESICALTEVFIICHASTITRGSKSVVSPSIIS